MTPPISKLRGDLTFCEQNSADGTIVVLKDPASGEYFRLQEAEQFIAQQLDGETSFETVRSRVEDKFGATLSPDVLADFVTSLDQNGLLEKDGGSSTPPVKRRRLNGSLLYFRIRLYDPARLFDRLVRRAWFFFTPQFVALSACLIGAAIAVTAFNWEAVVEGTVGLYKVSTLPLLVATLFTMLTAHEFAHGLTCKHFGGEVRELGFLMMYFQPALYCNVSDAWLFPEKSKRLWVGFAGPYFELFLWALATLAWRLTDPGTWINQVSLVAMGVSGIMTLLNFNPLIKLDGYYLLSDWLDIPNLRKKSFRYLGVSLRTLAGLVGKMPSVSRRERRIFLTYGLTAWIFSLSLLTYTALIVGEFLIIEKQRVAFFLFTGLFSLRLGSKFRKLFHRTSKKSESARVAKRRLARIGRSMLMLAAAGAVVAVLYLGRMELRVAGPITALPLHNADVRAEVEGIIAEISVDEGQRVEAGDVIARLLDHDIQAELQKTQARIDESGARLKLLEAGTRPEEIQLAKYVITRAEEQLKFAREREERNRRLYEEKLLSVNEYEESARLVAAGTSDLVEAKKKLVVLQAGSRPEEIEAMKAMIASLQTQHAQLERQLQLMCVVSPASGVVTTPSRQLKAMAHRFVEKGDLIAKVHDMHTIRVEIALSEKEIADVQTGQKVALKVRAYPELIFHGKVIGIATTAQGAAIETSGSSPAPEAVSADAVPSANRILVTTEIDNNSGLLKPGMTGMAKIYCGERRFIDLITRRISRTFRVEFWSWW